MNSGPKTTTKRTTQTTTTHVHELTIRHLHCIERLLISHEIPKASPTSGIGLSIQNNTPLGHSRPPNNKHLCVYCKNILPWDGHNCHKNTSQIDILIDSCCNGMNKPRTKHSCNEKNLLDNKIMNNGNAPALLQQTRNEPGNEPGGASSI